MIKKYALLAYVSLLASTAQIEAMDGGAGNGAAQAHTLPVSHTHSGTSDEKIRCSICLEDIDSLTTAEDPHITIKCSHTFHIKCLNEHVQTNAHQTSNGKWISLCPMCKAIITELEPDPDAARNMQEIKQLEHENADAAEARRLHEENGLPRDEDEAFIEGAEGVSPEELGFLLDQQERLDGYARRNQQGRQARGAHPRGGRGPKRPNNWWTSRGAFFTYGVVLLGAVWIYKQFEKKPRKNAHA